MWVIVALPGRALKKHSEDGGAQQKLPEAECALPRERTPGEGCKGAWPPGRGALTALLAAAAACLRHDCTFHVSVRGIVCVCGCVCVRVRTCVPNPYALKPSPRI